MVKLKMSKSYKREDIREQSIKEARLKLPLINMALKDLKGQSQLDFIFSVIDDMLQITDNSARADEREKWIKYFEGVKTQHEVMEATGMKIHNGDAQSIIKTYGFVINKLKEGE